MSRWRPDKESRYDHLFCFHKVCSSKEVISQIWAMHRQ